MRIAMFAMSAMLATAAFAATPSVGAAQRPVDGSLPERVLGTVLDRDRDSRDRNRNGSWDWERGRDDDRRRDGDRGRIENRDRREGRYDNRGRGVGRNNDRKLYEREQREFDRRTRRWNRYEWNAFRECEQDLWRRSRWDRNDNRRDEIFERRRIRDYCESRVNRARW